MTDLPTVLIVDDDFETKRIYQMMLNKMNYHTLAAQNVPEAIELLNHQIPNVILLDLMLPGQSGLELLKYVRTSPELAHIHVLMISAHRIDAGMLEPDILPDRILQKPIRIPELRSVLAQLTG